MLCKLLYITHIRMTVLYRQLVYRAQTLQTCKLCFIILLLKNHVHECKELFIPVPAHLLLICIPPH